MTEGPQLLVLEGAPIRIINRDGVRMEFYIDPSGGHLICAEVFSDDYLPASVRRCVEEQGMRIETVEFVAHLYVDEPLQRILLVMNTADVGHPLASFAQLADQWRRRLNERGSRDLLPVR